MSIALLVSTCLATGFVIRLVRRWPRLVFLVTLIGGASLFTLLGAASDEPVDVLGRTFLLDFSARIFLYPAMGGAVALAFFAPLRYDPAEDALAMSISNSRGAFFFGSLAPLIVAMALDSFPLAAFFWALGLIALLFLGRPRREGRAGGAAQFLLLVVIATSSLLLADRFFEFYPLTPENLDLARSAALFLAWGLGVMLALAPLHVWLGSLADEMPLLGTAFLVGVAQPVGLWLLLQRMEKLLWLTEKSALLNLLIVAGVVTVPIGALLALSERRDGRWLAYLSLVSLGHALIGFGLGTRLALTGVVLELLNRAIGVTLVAGGLTFVRYHPERRWQTLGALTILAGGFSLAGIPPTLGSISRWSIYRGLAGMNLSLILLLIASNATALLAIIQVVMPIFNVRAPAIAEGRTVGSPVRANPQARFAVRALPLPYFCAAVVALLLALLIVPGIFPQLIADPIIAALGKADYLK